MKQRYLGIGLGTLLFCTLPGCGDDDSSLPDDGSGGNGSNTGGNGNTGGSNNSAEPIEVSGEIDADTTWTSDNTYVLTELIYVVDDSTLTIEPGTTILGNPGSALLVTRGSQIDAQGTAANPIIFTSSADEGERAPSDWGGVVLLGSAPINVDGDAGGENPIEGVDATDERNFYGGQDDGYNCGTMRYVRIEFAGFELSTANELNALTVGGCGSDTILEYIQVHAGSDDGVEIFGGSVNLKYIVMSGGADDGLDWDYGWQGRAQFILVTEPDTLAENAIEADNHPMLFDATPRAMPIVYNVTFVGGDTIATAQRGMLLRRGTWGVIRNAIVTDMGTTAIDVRDAESVAGTEEDPLGLTVENSCFFNIGADGETYFADESAAAADNDSGFDEEAFFTDVDRLNVFGTDPELDENFVPGSDSVTDNPAAPPDGETFFDEVDYIGAFEPGADPWTDGWTAFPEN